VTTADRVLDAAGRCFARDGVRSTSIADVAAEAGVSRPTVYRWFADRDALHAAFVERAAERIRADVDAAAATVEDPADRLVVAMLTALRGVRSDPTVAAWFEDGAVEATGVAASFVHGVDGERAAWVVRVILSLLTVPGRDEAEERHLLERFVVPAVFSQQPATRATA
jgi:AcrR family transcriptional regulator